MPENKKNQAQNKEPVTAYTILEAFGKYSKYDPAQKSFNAMSSEWVYHHAGEKITQVCDEFDPSGTLAALYAKKYTEIEHSIRSVGDDVLEEVLELRYLQYMKWEDITDKMGYKDTRWVQRLHGRALKIISKNYSQTIESHV